MYAGNDGALFGGGGGGGLIGVCAIVHALHVHNSLIELQLCMTNCSVAINYCV